MLYIASEQLKEIIEVGHSGVVNTYFTPESDQLQFFLALSEQNMENLIASFDESLLNYP